MLQSLWVMCMSELSIALLAWYDAHRRTLPWRGIRDPYAEAFTRLQPLTVGFPSVLEALAARS